VDADGNDLWTTDGVALCVAGDDQYHPQIATDEDGGAVVVWEDERSGSYYDIYARRVYSDGTVVWTTDGVTLCGAAYDQEEPSIVSDGIGGAIVTWQDYRSNSDWDIYAQRVDSTGTVLWYTDGLTICALTDDQEDPQIAPDGSGGAIVTWWDERGVNREIYAQRLDANGNALWGTNGVTVSSSSAHKLYPCILPDWSGGAILAWLEGSYSDIYAQKLDSDGNPVWQPDGVTLCVLDKTQDKLEIASDGAGGAIVTWHDWRDHAPNYTDVYVQRVNSAGATVWATNGVSLWGAPS